MKNILDAENTCYFTSWRNFIFLTPPTFSFSSALWAACLTMSDGSTKTLLPLWKPNARSKVKLSKRRRWLFKRSGNRSRKIPKLSRGWPTTRKSLKVMATHKPVLNKTDSKFIQYKSFGCFGYIFITFDCFQNSFLFHGK